MRTAVSVPGVLLAPLLLAVSLSAAAQSRDLPDAPATVSPHSEDSRWWLSGQINLITQGHGGFASPYDGPHSDNRSRSSRAATW